MLRKITWLVLLFLFLALSLVACRIPNRPLMPRQETPMRLGVIFWMRRLRYNIIMIFLPSSTTYINQRNFVLAIGAMILAAVISYFVYELRYLRSPRLILIAPTQDIITDADRFDIRGRVDVDADLTLNSRPLYSGKTGEFEERIYLGKGLNRLEFEAKNRYGKTRRVIRYIVVK